MKFTNTRAFEKHLIDAAPRHFAPVYLLIGKDDFERKEVVTTNISFFRDFECWQMSVSWVPFGRFQSFGFNLQVKSGHLKDLLKIRQPRSDVQGRFDGLI